MSLLEDWETQPVSHDASDPNQSPFPGPNYGNEDFPQLSTDSVKPVFSLDTAKRTLSRSAIPDLRDKGCVCLMDVPLSDCKRSL